MPRRFLAFLMVLTALVVMPPRASAAPITSTTILTFSLTDTLESAGASSTPLLFDLFDAGLGTLSAVQFKLDVVSEELTAQLLGSPADVHATLAPSVDGLPGFPSGPLSLLDTFLGVPCTVGCTGFRTSSPLSYTYTVDYLPTLVAPFIGNGSLPLMLMALTDGTAQNATVAGTVAGSAYLTYTYEPFAPEPVPEPASLLLLATGLGAGVARRVRTTLGYQK